jgi:hypothetical protein
MMKGFDMAKRLGRSLGKSKGLVNIPVYYRWAEGKYGNDQFQVLSLEEGKKAVAAGDDSVEVLNTQWRSRSWRTMNSVSQSSYTYNPQTGMNDLDLLKYQDNLFKQCLVSWDLVDDNDQPIDITNDSLDEIPEDIVKTLIRAYDRLNVIDPEMQKK